MTENFEKLYGELIDNLTSRIKEESVEYISISTFRCPAELMNIIRQRPNPSILTKGDFIKGIDGKTRYFKAERIKMISFVTERLKKHWKKPFIYYCMEHSSIWAKEVAVAMDQYMKSLPADDTPDPYASIPVADTVTSDVLAEQQI